MGATLRSTLKSFWEQQEKQRGEKISVYAVSNDTGLAWETINNLREDKTRRFDGDVVAKICKYFGVPEGDPIPFLTISYGNNKGDYE